MSLWYCEGHGFTGPMPCCGHATTATIQRDGAPLALPVTLAPYEPDDAFVWFEAERTNAAHADRGMVC